MTVKPSGDFYGLPTGRVDNGAVAVEFLWEGGPRLVRLFLASSRDSLLAETPSASWQSPHGVYSLRGGHRLWSAPETPGTSVPDHGGLKVEQLPRGARLVGPTEAASGLQKTIEIRLDVSQPSLDVIHRLANTGHAPIVLAPWAITMLRPGGMAIVPQPVEPIDAGGLQPNRSLVLWPRSRWNDERLHLGERFWFIGTEPSAPPAKFGTINRAGWMGYVWNGVLFVKRFELQPGAEYPDRGCNAEVYVCDEYLELESLGPLVTLEPGAMVRHTERWELYRIQHGNAIPSDYLQALGALKVQDLPGA